MTSLLPPVANATGMAGSLCTSVYSHERSAKSELLVGERNMIRSHREGGCANCVPVLPCLQAGAKERKMQRFPEVEHFVTVLNDVVERAA